MIAEQPLEHYYAVIMAGGGGTRLWPLSRVGRPKQMLQLFDERTLFQVAVQRLQGLFRPENILVVTVADQAPALMAQAPEIPPANFLPEPAARGTAAVVGLGAVAVQQRDPQGVMAVLTADHFIRDEAHFRRLLRLAYQVAQTDYLVTLGIQPTAPSSGFGYIQFGELLGEWEGQKVHRVRRFKEKPNEVQARQMLAEGNHVWNSGMFFWRSRRILAEFDRHMPQLAQALAHIAAAWDSPQQQAVLQREWMALEPETIDYGIMEKAEQVAVIPAEGLGWSDVGIWDALYEILAGDGQGNIVQGAAHVGLDTHGCLIFGTSDTRLIATLGVQDLIIVDAGDALLVCRRDQSQLVRQLVQHLKETGSPYL